MLDPDLNSNLGLYLILVLDLDMDLNLMWIHITSRLPLHSALILVVGKYTTHGSKTTRLLGLVV